MKNLVSIIIPAYNSESYISRCLDSIIAQSYKNIEIIIINDGSCDATEQIVFGYMKNNSNIIYKFQENAGSSVAKNNGISFVNGEYITFCDSDDTFDKDYIKTLIDHLDEETDVVVSGYTNVDENGSFISKRLISEKPLGIYSCVANCSKLYRTSFIRENNIHFLCGVKVFEDAYFSLSAFALARKISFAKFSGYNIYQNTSSVTHTFGKSLSIFDDTIIGLKNIKRDIKTKDPSELDYFIIRTAIYTTLFSCKKAEKNELFSKIESLFKWVDENTQKNNRFLSPFLITGEPFSIRIIILLFCFLRKINLLKPIIYLYSKI